MKKLIVAPALLLLLLMVSNVNSAQKERLNGVLDKDQVEARPDDKVQQGPGVGKQRMSEVHEDKTHGEEGKDSNVIKDGSGGKQRYNSGILDGKAESKESDAQ